MRGVQQQQAALRADRHRGTPPGQWRQPGRAPAAAPRRQLLLRPLLASAPLTLPALPPPLQLPAPLLQLLGAARALPPLQLLDAVQVVQRHGRAPPLLLPGVPWLQLPGAVLLLQLLMGAAQALLPLRLQGVVRVLQRHGRAPPLLLLEAAWLQPPGAALLLQLLLGAARPPP